MSAADVKGRVTPVVTVVPLVSSTVAKERM